MFDQMARLPNLEQPSPQPIWEWLSSTKELQENTYNYDYDFFRHAHNRGRTDLVDYLDKMTTAAVQELAEIREEFSWKPWATDKPFVKRDRILAESVDVLHFIGNILTAIGVDDEEFWEAYRRKQQINRDRQASGNYSAQKGGLAEGSD